MNDDDSQLLQQLRDIHGAGEPGWWPPAPGWWLLALVFLLALALLLRMLMRQLAMRRRRNAWLRELEALNWRRNPEQYPHEYLAGLNRLFRAVAVKAFPETACARLQGEPWVEWIRELLPEQANSDGLGALSSGPYEPAPRFDAEKLNELARTWVKLYG